MSKNILFIILIATTFSCIHNTPEIAKGKNNIKDSINIQLNDTIKINWKFLNQIKNTKLFNPETNKLKYTLFVFSDGECSFCIIALIDWLKKMKKVKYNNSSNIIIIAKAPDEFLLEFYFKKMNLQIEKNEYLLTDSILAFGKFNPFIKQNESGVILTDSVYNVLIKGDPFQHANIYNLYLKLGIINEEKDAKNR